MDLGEVIDVVGEEIRFGGGSNRLSVQLAGWIDNGEIGLAFDGRTGLVCRRRCSFRAPDHAR